MGIFNININSLIYQEIKYEYKTVLKLTQVGKKSILR